MNAYPPPYEPTPAEIAAACERIRASWPPREEYQRRTILRRQWQPPTIELEPDVARAIGA